MSLEQKRKRGRPKGSKNCKVKIIDVRPTTCPNCESTDISILRVKVRDEWHEAKPIIRDIARTFNGQCYNRVVWRRSKCNSCGQHLMVRSYEFDPDLTRS